MKRLLVPLLTFFLTLIPAMAHASALGDCSNQIKYGAPSNSGTLLCRLAYVESYDGANKTPGWVAYHLTKMEIHGNFLRTRNFHPDPELSKSNSSNPSDYQHSTYIPGQMVPARDMIWSARAVEESYLLSSVAPMNRSMANSIWAALQQKVRNLVQSRGELYIAVGPIYASQTPKTIGRDHVAVPSGFFEVIFDPVRVDAIAFIIPNHAEPSQDLPKFVTSINSIEKKTGLNFLPNLDSNVKTIVESTVSPFWLQ